MAVPRAWLIDASIYIFRAWFSMPDRWHTPEGRPLRAVYGYARFLLDFLEQAGELTYCAAAFDESLGSNFRNGIFPAYKSSRVLPDEELAFQLACCRQLTECLGIACFGCSRYEADDYLATLARLCRERDVAVTVITRDKDLGQLLCGETDLWWDFAGGERLDEGAFRQRFGVRPTQFADYLALVGDPVDDIPGVPGIGPKTAVQLLHAYTDLDTLGRNLDRVAELPLRGAAAVAGRLRDNWPQVLLSRKLTGLHPRIPGVDAAPAFELRAEGVRALGDFLEGLGIAGPLPARCRKIARGLSV